MVKLINNEAFDIELNKLIASYTEGMQKEDISEFVYDTLAAFLHKHTDMSAQYYFHLFVLRTFKHLDIEKSYHLWRTLPLGLSKIAEHVDMYVNTQESSRKSPNANFYETNLLLSNGGYSFEVNASMFESEGDCTLFTLKIKHDTKNILILERDFENDTVLFDANSTYMTPLNTLYTIFNAIERTYDYKRQNSTATN